MQNDDIQAPSKLRAWLRREGRRNGWLADQCQVNPATLTRWLTSKSVPQPVYRGVLERITEGAVMAEDWEAKK